MEAHGIPQQGHGRAAGHATPHPEHATHGPAHIAPMPTIHPPKVELEPLGLVDTVETPGVDGASKIRAFGVADTGARRAKWKREPCTTGSGACRVRTFRGKLSDQGMEFLDNSINEWLDDSPEIEVKFVTSTVGTFEGKMREPALILNLWY